MDLYQHFYQFLKIPFDTSFFKNDRKYFSGIHTVTAVFQKGQPTQCEITVPTLTD